MSTIPQHLILEHITAYSLDKKLLRYIQDNLHSDDAARDILYI